MQIDHNDLYPYLLVNIGSGVSMIKVPFLFLFCHSFDLVLFSASVQIVSILHVCRLMEMGSFSGLVEQM